MSLNRLFIFSELTPYLFFSDFITCPNQASQVVAEANFCKLWSVVEDTPVIGSCSESEMKRIFSCWRGPANQPVG